MTKVRKTDDAVPGGLFRGRVAATDLSGLLVAIQSPVSFVILLDADLRACLDPGFRQALGRKPVFVHLDLMKGLASDRSSLEFLGGEVGFAGVVSTRSNLVRSARSLGLMAIQRSFLIDTHSLETTLESLAKDPPDAVEFMPGLAVEIIPYLKQRLSIPLIMAGLIQTEAQVQAALAAGSDAVSMSRRELWAGV